MRYRKGQAAISCFNDAGCYGSYGGNVGEPAVYYTMVFIAQRRHRVGVVGLGCHFAYGGRAQIPLSC